MRKSSLLLLLAALISTSAAQVVSPVEIKQPELRALQQKYMDDLKRVGEDILANGFEYPFYLSRKLDLDEQQQKNADQRSLRFDHYNGQTVLAITGNYYAAYSAEKVSREQRAHDTFLNVVIPILKAAVPRFQNSRDIQGYAVEVSHHILGKVMGVSMERPENLFVFLPQAAAVKLLVSKDDAVQQSALLQAQILLNAEPITVWLHGQGPQLANNPPPADAKPGENDPSPDQAGVEIVREGERTGQSLAGSPLTLKAAKQPPAAPPRDTSPEALRSLQASQQEVLSRVVKELESQAHFVAYASPSFVAFRQGIYLELSFNTTLPEPASGSRYKLAALAFDEHVAHLIRPMLGYFKGEQKFDGIGFSTTVHLSGKAAGAGTEAVEFFFPFAALRCYETYECTGQQLIDAGSVLINGERVGLDLQIAEGGSGR